MYLVISEKPSVSQAIGKVIGAYKKKNGYLEGRDCVVSWCLGHLAEYVPPERYSEAYKSWNFAALPIFPEEWKLSVASDKRKQYNVLKELLLRTDFEYVVNACDAGREGELIFYRVYDLTGSHIPVKRLWISSMEDTAIADGFAALKDAREYQNLKEAAICRAKADWLIGMNATRALTSTYFHKLTVGRVQTPTLAMLVERNEQIQHFKKQKYFHVDLDCGAFTASTEKITEEERARAIAQNCNGASAFVREIKSTGKTTNPPKLYDLTTLQRECNRYFGYTAKQTLEYVQNLYEKKLTTYPRTDSQFLSDDMGDTAKNVIEIVKQVYEIAPFLCPDHPMIARVLNSSKVTDHHAIIPTLEFGKQDLSDLSDGEKKVLMTIAMRLIMATADPYRYEETEITLQCEDELFFTKEKSVKESGWKELEVLFFDKIHKKRDGSDEKNLPQMGEGEIFSGIKANCSEHFTTPPKPYSEDMLLSAMETAGNKDFAEDTEKKGLGTPATRASIIEKLVSAGFAKRSGKQIVPTDSGMELIAIVPDFLKSAAMTAEWENQLLGMERGEIRSDEFMDGICELVQNVLQTCRELSSEERSHFHPREELGKCPVCGSPVYAGKNNFYCSNQECQFALWKENYYLGSMRKELDAGMAKELLKNGKVPVKRLYSAKKDTYFDATLLMSIEDGKVKFGLEFPKVKKKSSKK